MSTEKFKVGDLVFSLQDGWETIVGILDDAKYPILTRRSFWQLDGKYNEEDLAPTLFTEEEALVKFPEFPPPKKKVMKGRVLYKFKDFF